MKSYAAKAKNLRRDRVLGNVRNLQIGQFVRFDSEGENRRISHKDAYTISIITYHLF